MAHHPAACRALRSARLVVVIGAGDPADEAAMAEDLGIDPSRLVTVRIEERFP